MTSLSRRRFLQMSGGAIASTFLSDSIARAANIPAQRRTGSLDDVEHIVVLMQENRSFDHYFGSLRGVRGFGDPHPATRSDGKSVWHQSDGTREYTPFRPQHHDLGLAFLEDLDHTWSGGHAAFNTGRYDQWIPAKTPTTMAYLQRSDIPFHYSLADAFTICDSYHCSLLGPTDPNRYYMFSGWVGNDGKGGGPVIDNAERGYDWTTYPERLQRAGVSWKVYQDRGTGLDAANKWGLTEDPFVGNYGDNSLLYFNSYRNADPDDPLHVKARNGTNAAATGDRSLFDALRADVTSGALPQVSWIAAPEAYTEHPSWPVNYGAWYLANVLDALTADPNSWAKTALLITYDENDGFFDHVVPPHAHGAGVPGDSTVSVANEIFPGSGKDPSGAYGLGQRVPMLVVSPWSVGGWVCSEVFDHTSLLRLMEKRFGVAEPNITPWRRAVCGDLTSAFDFGTQKSTVPTLLPAEQYRPTKQKQPDYVPKAPPAGAVPTQEWGYRPSRPLGYKLAVAITTSADATELALDNSGRLGAHFQVRAASLPAPYSLTVGAQSTLKSSVPADQLTVHGPSGFYREVRGAAVDLTATERLSGERLVLTLTSSTTITATLHDHYGPPQRVTVNPGTPSTLTLARRQGWYSAELHAGDHVRVWAGRVETGSPSVSDPRLGAR